MDHNLLKLISEAKKGKNTAQTTLLNAFWNNIYLFVYSKTKNATDSEDITIETFTKVFKKLSLYNTDFEFITWLRAIAYNTMIDYYRRKPDKKISLDAEYNKIDIEANTPSPEQNLILKQRTSDLLKQIERLPPIYKEAIKLRYLEDKTYKQIAVELKLSMANVKVRILRGKNLLVKNVEN